MSCFTECQDLKVYDYNRNQTIEISECSCKGCCSNITMFIYFLYFCSLTMISILLCEMSSYKKRQRDIILTHEELPPYTDNV